jgi:hypothetical protein
VTGAALGVGPGDPEAQSEAAPRPSTIIRQNAYVVEDLDKAVDDWSRQFGIGPFYCLRHVQFESAHYRGKPIALDISVALCFSGDLCLELIEQHSPGPSAYRDVVAPGQRGFHHILVYPQDYDAEICRYQQQGFDVAGGGILKASGMQFVYIDTRRSLGCMVELASRDTPAQWRPLIEAARRWKPGDPAIREIAGLS